MEDSAGGHSCHAQVVPVEASNVLLGTGSLLSTGTINEEISLVCTRRCWRRRSAMRPWATAAWGAWRRASWTPWQPWTCRPGATASATSTACSARRATGSNRVALTVV